MTEKTCETCLHGSGDGYCSACRTCAMAAIKGGVGVALPGWEPKPASEPVSDPDGWIEWGGGKCPVKPGVIVITIRRNGFKLAAPGITLRWEHWHEPGTGRANDIVRYRVVKPAAEPDPVAEPETVAGSDSAEYQNCDTCAHHAAGEFDVPCRDCSSHTVYSGWQPITVSAPAKGPEFRCCDCEHYWVDSDGEPCAYCELIKKGARPTNWKLASVTATKSSAFATQVGGSHYTQMAIQPAEYIHRNGIGFMEGSAIAYLSRWRSKGGVEDLRKAVHTILQLIEMEERS